MTYIKKFSLGLVSAAALAAFSIGPAKAIVVTQDTVASSLVSAILGSVAGITVTGSSLSGQSSGGAVSSGTYDNSVAGTYGIGDGIMLSSGNVSDYDTGSNDNAGNTTNFGSSATGAQEALLDPITGGALDHYDVTQLDLTFDVDATVSDIFFNVVFGSDEYAEYVGSSFIDAFGIYLNGVNIALFNGQAVNIDHSDMAFIGGTELDGILDPTGGTGDPIMLFNGAVAANSTGNTLTFIIADSGDNVLDSTVYISGFGSSDPGGGEPGGGIQIPEPASLGILAFGLFGLAVARRRRSA